MKQTTTQQSRERIYKYYSPLKKAANLLVKALPAEEGCLSGKPILSDEPWRIFRFQTDDLAVVRLTVNRAFQNCGIVDPKWYSVDEFYRKIAKPEETQKGSGKPNFKKSITETEFIQAVKTELKEHTRCAEQCIFIYANPSGNGREPKLSDDALWIMQTAARECAEERAWQFKAQIEDQASAGLEPSSVVAVSNRLFFALYGPSCKLPGELSASVMTVEYDPLTPEDFRSLLQEFHMRNELMKSFKFELMKGAKDSCKSVKRPEDLESGLAPLTVDDSVCEWYADRMSGMDEIVVRRLLRSMNNAFPEGCANYNELDKIEVVIADYKNRILKQHDRLEVIPTEDAQKHRDEKTVVGLDSLQKWVSDHKDAIKRFGNPPTGIMLVGIPGTGKSATAKEVARELRLPLVRLNMAKILGKYVGESESGMQEMLEDLRFVAPCVLWIDEIEKAMSGADGKSDGSGVIQRLFGMLLTFMQENKRPVFTVTTANDISRLPPEFFRNGRFDQVFSLMMPNYRECKKIMQLKLNDYAEKLNWGYKFDENVSAELLDLCLGTPKEPRFLTGADIEAHVKELFWYYKSKYVRQFPGKDEEGMEKFKEKLKEFAGTVRAQASPAAPHTMDDLSARYLDMIQRGLKTAGSENTHYIGKNLTLDRVQNFVFDEKKSECKLPMCMTIPKGYEKYESAEKCKAMKTSEWYDARFFFELVSAMSRCVLMNPKLTMENARQEYWNMKTSSNKKTTE